MTGRKKKTEKKKRRSGAKKIIGAADRPRISVFRSLNHIYAQIMDDLEGKVLVSASTVQKDFKERWGKEAAEKPTGGNVKAAGLLGKILAERALEKGISEVVFDRGRYHYHGRIKALAESCRRSGLKF